jgi:hypothetical protein
MDQTLRGKEVTNPFDDLPKIRNDRLNDWQTKLFDLGYIGPYDLGSLLDRLPVDVEEADPDIRMTLTLYATDAGTWRVGYVAFDAEGRTHIEAVAKLMIEHPDIWLAEMTMNKYSFSLDDIFAYEPLQGADTRMDTDSTMNDTTASAAIQAALIRQGHDKAWDSLSEDQRNALIKQVSDELGRRGVTCLTEKTA